MRNERQCLVALRLEQLHAALRRLHRRHPLLEPHALQLLRRRRTVRANVLCQLPQLLVKMTASGL